MSSSTPAVTHLCPVQSLPTELLRETFIFVVSSCKKPIGMKSSAIGSYSINIDIRPPLCLSQTCSRWRDIACRMPQLWMAVSNMTIGRRDRPTLATQVNKHIFSLFLKRAEHLPLSVLLANDIHAANKLSPHMDHMRTLKLTDYMDPYALDPLSRPAPTLECFLLASPRRMATYIPSRQQRLVLFAGHAPSLRALALFNPPALPEQQFSALTDLHISMLWYPDLQDLLGLLKGTPALESLSILDFHASLGPLEPAPGQNPVPATPLHRLRRLAVVRTPLFRGMALLAQLAMPRDVAVHILELSTDRRASEPLPHLPPVAAANVLEIVACGSTLSFHTRVRAVDGSLASVPRARCSAGRTSWTYGWWTGLWRTLPCARLTELRVAVDAEDDEFLPRFLGAAVALTTLELRLHQRETEGQRGREENVRARLDGASQALVGMCTLLLLPAVCPLLAELAVIDAASTPQAWDGLLSGGQTSPRVSYVPDMLGAVATRAAAGRMLSRVALQGRWRRTQREGVRNAFNGMGVLVGDFVFRDLEAGTPPLFEFEDDRGEEAWVNRHWSYELPKNTLPWAPVNGADEE